MSRYTYGINRFDGRWVGNWPNRQFEYVAPVEIGPISWADYVDVLREASTISRSPDSKDKTCMWTAPFLLGMEGEGRGMDNVVGMSDFVSFDLDAPGWSFERLTRRLSGLRYVLYTTTNSRPFPNQRWRIVVSLDREHTVEEYGAVWACVDDLLDHALDHKTHNANRILFVPARWVGADNIFHEVDGAPLPVDAILAAGYLPVEVETYQPIAFMGLHERPEGRAIITENMERKFVESARGGRFWKLLCQAAKWHAENDWELGDQELCDAALAVSLTYAPGVKRQNPLREAQRALAWADVNVVPKSALERAKDYRDWFFNRPTRTF